MESEFRKTFFILFLIIYPIVVFGASGGNPLLGKWESIDSKSYITIEMERSNEGLVIHVDGFVYSLNKEKNNYFYKKNPI